LLWVLNHIHHEDWNILYVEVTGNTHPLCNKYVHETAKELGVQNKLIHAKREDLEFFECFRKWGIPLWGKHRWCLHQFKRKLFEKHSHFINVTGIRRGDSKRRSKMKQIGFMRWSQKVCVNPIFEWSTKQVLSYIREHEIPLNPCYAIYGHSGNCMFCIYHKTSQIIRTLQDPYWAEKIVNALSLGTKYSKPRVVAFSNWKKWIGQTTLTKFSANSEEDNSVKNLKKFEEERIYMGPKDALIPRGARVILINRIGRTGVFIYDGKIFTAPIRILHKPSSSISSKELSEA